MKDQLLPLDEKELDFLEQQVPRLAEAATHQAFWNALNAGHQVVIAEGEDLVEVSRDGTRRVIGAVARGVEVPVGTRIKIR